MSDHPQSRAKARALSFLKLAYVPIGAGIVVLFGLLVLFTLPLRNVADAASGELYYSCNVEGDLYAATYSGRSTSPYWWVSSGGRMLIREGICETIQGRLPSDDPSRIDYARVNPLDTQNGYYPQNTFRAVTKSTWGNSEQAMRFRITAQNHTNTPNRDGYSGVFLFNRYKDKDNLYYAGVRDDGLAVIKKKIGEEYYTLTYTQVFGDFNDYNKSTMTSFLPTWQWMGLKTRVTTNADGSVKLQLFLDKNDSGVWRLVASYTDRGVGGTAFSASGHGGIRSDYMDVQFDDYYEKAI
jgi:hypothetical protein